MTVHELMRLFITNDRFYIQPLESTSSEVLVIDRVTQEISLQGDNGPIPAAAVTKDICGILGIIRLIAGPYLVVITKRAKVGEINGHTIWKVTATEILSYKRTTMHLNEQQSQDNKTYMSMAEHILGLQSYYYSHTYDVNTVMKLISSQDNKAYMGMVEHILGLESYYYSHTYDVTHSMQRLYNTSPDFIHMPLHERADPRFVWNGHLLRELTQQPELARFCLPVMLGFIEMRQSSVNSNNFTYVLISRRSCFRAGTRYYMRGLDQEGHAANFVETEQIVEIEGYKSSFVQTRGSVPMFWSQRPNLKYKPDPQIHPVQDHLSGFQVHFATQIYNYGKQVLINLLDQKGKEDQLVKGFASAVENAHNEKIKYEPFDFHHECRKMRWDRLSILVDRVANTQRELGYFLCQKDGSVTDLQSGVFRTNCIDCLDRTNVVQSLLARVNLQTLFTRLGYMEMGQRVEDQQALEYMFKNIWADNADACAKQYAGTGALKTDFTRTGARTKFGLLKDGYNSAIRYMLNNFKDGFKQDAIDLFLGNYIVEENEGLLKPSPLRPDSDWKFYALPTIFIVAFSMAVISILIPDEHPSEQFMYVLFWGGASIMSLAAIYFYGNDFVNKPKLAQAKFKTE